MITHATLFFDDVIFVLVTDAGMCYHVSMLSVYDYDITVYDIIFLSVVSPRCVIVDNSGDSNT